MTTPQQSSLQFTRTERLLIVTAAVIVIASAVIGAMLVLADAFLVAA